MRYLKLYEDFNIDYSFVQEPSYESEGVFRLEAKIKDKLIGYIDYIFLDKEIYDVGPEDSTTSIFPEEVKSIMLKSSNDSYCDIISLWVDKEYRGNKIAKRLIEKVIRKAKSSKIHDVVLYAKPYIKGMGSNSAIEIIERLKNWYYKNFGFKKIKEKSDGFLMYKRI